MTLDSGAVVKACHPAGLEFVMNMFVDEHMNRAQDLAEFWKM